MMDHTAINILHPDDLYKSMDPLDNSWDQLSLSMIISSLILSSATTF